MTGRMRYENSVPRAREMLDRFPTGSESGGARALAYPSRRTTGEIEPAECHLFFPCLAGRR